MDYDASNNTRNCSKSDPKSDQQERNSTFEKKNPQAGIWSEATIPTKFTASLVDSTVLKYKYTLKHYQKVLSTTKQKFAKTLLLKTTWRESRIIGQMEKLKVN
jgi:hypothetical protein